ncbi:MAG: restriction endonuclease [Flavobacteriaceae bacterium]|nr:restriction endonuclease [Flavobacteriaceae bacterium]
MEYIEGKNLTLDEFLEKLFSKESELLFPNNCFPTKEMGDLFISNITFVSEKSIKNILRKFMIKNSTFGADETAAEILWEHLQSGKIDLAETLESERYRRLLILRQNKDFLVWEGITWIIDLLPNQPKLALDILTAYLHANFWHLPDYAISGLLDSCMIIRAKFIEYEHPKEIYQTLSPLDFEKLTSKLFSELGYEANLTKRSHDKGIDVLIRKTSVSKKEKTVIQCKRPEKRKITFSEVNELLGTVTSEKATKGIFVTSTDYSKDAINYAMDNPSIELINGKQLATLMNEYFGIHWVSKIESILNRTDH